MKTIERQTAITALIKASRLCQHVQQQPQSSLTKNDRSPVTVADFGVQAVISKLFPQDPILGEEDISLLINNCVIRSKIIEALSAIGENIDDKQLLKLISRCAIETEGIDRYWVLDPIDGTKGFLRGDQYAIALALIEKGQVTLGALACPNLTASPLKKPGSLFIAVKGKGTYLRSFDDPTEYPIKVADTKDPTNAIFCESVEKGHSSHTTSSLIIKNLNTQTIPLRIDSQCKYGAVSCGDASVYLRLPTSAEYEEKVWDHAAGSIIVEEAGGKVSDIFGKPLDFNRGQTLKNNKGIICTNKYLHDQVLNAVQKALKKSF